MSERRWFKRIFSFIVVSIVALGAISGTESLPPVYTHGESFHKKDGLPADKIYSIAVDGDRIWAGTENGLALYEDGKLSSLGVKDGLVYPMLRLRDSS